MEAIASAMHQAVVGGTTTEMGDRDPTPGSDPSVEPTRRIARDDEIELSPVRPAVPDAEWMRGVNVGRYELRECIGAGGLGVVFAGFDPRLGREVAVKLLRPDRAALADHRARVLREAQAMAQIRHANVVEVYDVGESDDRGATVYVVMELLDGVSLQEWLTRRPSWRAIVAAFADAARGLAAAHRRGVIHRDFKPTNAMIGRDGRVRVLDFGLARGSIDENSTEVPLLRSSDDMLSIELTDADKVLGTPPYMAPEQHVGARVDGRADQFALCVALYEALLRRRPFVGETVRELTDAKVVGRMLPIPHHAIPGGLRRVLERGLSPDPDRRFPTMDALALALDRVLRRRSWNPLATLGAGATIAAALVAITAVGRPATTAEPPAISDMVSLAATTAVAERDADLAHLIEREAAAWVVRADAARRGGRLEEALAAATRALELVRALHDEDHPATLAGIRLVESVRRQLQEHSQAGMVLAAGER
jgi:tRNA A-37 threonylcarbamoyl transferase component Bud32